MYSKKILCPSYQSLAIETIFKQIVTKKNFNKKCTISNLIEIPNYIFYFYKYK